ncbi:unnamed protein product [Allacma fusca]|uniref:EGF-like domain-containing protein n=1 Tax=Allacma fusca TaxID=39272 RepID=A0A8J2MEN6_9HEXA|nr:unnamed protein product [Allacma fusca]
MISFNALLIFLIVLHCSSLGLNSEEADEPSTDLSSTNAPLCRLVRNMKRSLHDEFKSRFKEELVCDIDASSNCTSVTCSSPSNETVSAGLLLDICSVSPSVTFWVDTSNRSNESSKWSHSFYVQNETQKMEIHPIVGVHGHSLGKSYLTVNLNLDHSHTRAKNSSPYNYLLFNATIEVSTAKHMKPITEAIVNSTRFPLAGICAGAPAEPQMLEEKQPLELRRSFMRAEELSSEDVHISSKRTSTSSLIGQKCDQKQIFQCGVGATCVMTAQGGICECLKDYILAQNRSCIPHREIPPTPNPTVQPLPSSASNSTLGAILSILTLLAIAAAVFFGTKYRFFSRIRSHLPLTVPVWPFRRDTTVDDQVNMVDPFSQEEDDPPLL